MIKKIWNNIFNKTDWHNLRSTKPISKVFGLDRGMPIDRYYIGKFLNENKNYISGKVLEIGENTYSKKYGTNVSSFEVLHVDNKNKNATIIGDLTKPETLPQNEIDCLICTQTLNFIYDFNKAIQGIHHLQKKNGTALVTAAGICQISRYDMDRWGDYWRFTTKSASKAFSEIFGKKNIKVDFYGNVLSSISFLEGIASNELTDEELDFKDKDYEMLITVIAKKN
ncbi:MAG: methyltransferase domain-containing protein [Ignavibacteriaceae bacterium]